MPFLTFFRKIFEVILAAIFWHAFSIIHIFIFMAIFFVKKLHTYVYMRAYLY